MQHKHLLYALVVVFAATIIGIIVWLETFSGGRGQGMGGAFAQSYLIIVVAVPLVIAVLIVGYAIVFPDLTKKNPESSHPPNTGYEQDKSAYDAVLRVLKKDEATVIEALSNEGGVMLQKDIRWKTGYSRVKIHRILTRLAERGIVSATKHYNTNKITLADWLIGEETKKKGQSEINKNISQ